MAVLKQLSVKDATTIRADMLRTVRNGFLQRGVEAPQVGPTTDWYITATAVGNELAAIGYNAVLANDAQMPDTAQGNDLIRIAAFLKRAQQGAAGSIGPIILSSSAPSPVPSEAQLTDSLGQKYKVLVGGIYASGAPIIVEAVSLGAATNHPEGDALQWVDGIPYADTKALVGPGGLVNGINAEGIEVLRQRLLAVFQVPPGNENWSEVVELAEASTFRVSKAFAHPAVQGPSTYDISLTAAPTATNKSRVVADVVVTSEVEPFVLGVVSGSHFGTITSVEDIPTDIAIALVIPDAPTASPPGIGGGWLDGTPWPRPDGVSTFKCVVTAVTDSKTFTVDAVESPVASVSHISWLNQLNGTTEAWTIFSAVVTSVTGTAGAWVITLDQPFPGIAVGCFIWPSCKNSRVYMDSLLDEYALMGPGEKSSNASALVRGFRHPPPSVSWPASIGAHLAHALEKSSEVSAAQFLYRSDGTTNLNGSVGILVPSVPASYAAPRIFTPRNIGIYRLP